LAGALRSKVIAKPEPWPAQTVGVGVGGNRRIRRSGGVFSKLKIGCGAVASLRSGALHDIRHARTIRR